MSAIDEKFAQFHAENPHIYRALCALARGALARGKRRIGIGALWERMRWDMWLDSTEADPKLNNDYRSRYARLMMASEPDLAGVFEIRALRSSETTPETAEVSRL